MGEEDKLFQNMEESLKEKLGKEEEGGSPPEDMPPADSPGDEGASPQEEESKPQDTGELSDKEKPEEGEETKEEVKEEVKEEPQRFPLEITLDTGEKIVINNEEELKSYLLKAKGADRKFQEAAELRKQIEAQLTELQEREAKLVDAILKAQDQFERGADLFALTQELNIQIPFEKLVEAQHDDEVRDELFKTEILPVLRQRLKTLQDQTKQLRDELNKYRHQEFIQKLRAIPVYQKMEEIDKESAAVILAGIVDALAQIAPQYNWGDDDILEKTREFLNKFNEGVNRYIESRADEVVIKDKNRAKRLLNVIKEKYPELLKEYGDEYVKQYLESLQKQNQEVSPGLAGGGISSEKETKPVQRAGQYESEEESLIKKFWQFFKD